MANSTHTQQALAADPQFRRRVRAALSSAAWQIINEAPGTLNHAHRLAYAQQVTRQLESEVGIILPSFVMRPNVFQFETTHVYDFELLIGQVVTASGDADLLSQLVTDWDDMAAAAGFAD